MADVDLAGAAALMHRSYDWFSRHWRELRDREGFPSPFVGDVPGGRPWWRRAAIDAWIDRQSGAPVPATSGDFTQRNGPIWAANDPVPIPTPPGGRVAKLLAAAGGQG
jgi:hypothetical protein